MNSYYNFNIWDGIYESFTAAQADTSAFESQQWIQGLENKATKFKADLASNKFLIPQTNSHEYPLTILVAMQPPVPLNILDFGGGLASQYLQLCAHLPTIDHLRYHIVECEALCKRAATLFPNEQNLFFHSQLPQDIKNFDIIHLGSSLQYIENWRMLLTDLTTKYHPQFLVLSDLMAGDIPTFASTQHYYGSKIATWFFNIKDILAHVNSLEYNLKYKSLYQGIFLNEKQDLPMNNFPASHQLKQACNLVFSKE